MPNNISLDEAVTMTSRYRANRATVLKEAYQPDEILLTCETFYKEAFEDLLSQSGCEKIRIYFGMTEGLQVRAIAVGVDSNGADMLPSLNINYKIVEEGTGCPQDCPPPSPLNEDV